MISCGKQTCTLMRTYSIKERMKRTTNRSKGERQTNHANTASYDDNPGCVDNISTLSSQRKQLALYVRVRKSTCINTCHLRRGETPKKD